MHIKKLYYVNIILQETNIFFPIVISKSSLTLLVIKRNEPYFFLFPPFIINIVYYILIKINSISIFKKKTCLNICFSFLYFIDIVCYLFITGSIPVVTVSQPTYSGTTGQSVTLQCTVSSPNDALQSVSWTFNNGASTIIIAAFSNTAKYSGTTTTTPSLTIFNLASTDAGTYTCSATNTIGTGSSSATSLSVTGSKL